MAEDRVGSCKYGRATVYVEKREWSSRGTEWVSEGYGCVKRNKERKRMRIWESVR
jgi:hypothetical protein